MSHFIITFQYSGRLGFGKLKSEADAWPILRKTEKNAILVQTPGGEIFLPPSHRLTKVITFDNYTDFLRELERITNTRRIERVEVNPSRAS
jgi:hypothetical protein